MHLACHIHTPTIFPLPLRQSTFNPFASAAQSASSKTSTWGPQRSPRWRDDEFALVDRQCSRNSARKGWRRRRWTWRVCSGRQGAGGPPPGAGASCHCGSSWALSSRILTGFWVHMSTSSISEIYDTELGTRVTSQYKVPVRLSAQYRLPMYL